MEKKCEYLCEKKIVLQWIVFKLMSASNKLLLMLLVKVYGLLNKKFTGFRPIYES